MPGHYRLWIGGIEHGDVSVNNLMYDKLNGDCGVLNDFDLAHWTAKPRPSGSERTGTMPFMALDLLNKDAWEGKVTRLYQHDCESFMWVLLWVCCSFDNGEETVKPPFLKFVTNDYDQCRKEKWDVLRDGVQKLPNLVTKSYEAFREPLQKLLSFFMSLEATRMTGKLVQLSGEGFFSECLRAKDF
jgi:hypothetical protein